jgi:hypothetical protein
MHDLCKKGIGVRSLGDPLPIEPPTKAWAGSRSCCWLCWPRCIAPSRPNGPRAPAPSPRPPDRPADRAPRRQTWIPAVLAAGPVRGWLLLADAGMSLREHLEGRFDPAAWAAMLPRFGQLQRAVEPFTGELLTAGHPGRAPRPMPRDRRTPARAHGRPDRSAAPSSAGRPEPLERRRCRSGRARDPGLDPAQRPAGRQCRDRPGRPDPILRLRRCVGRAPVHHHAGAAASGSQPRPRRCGRPPGSGP